MGTIIGGLTSITIKVIMLIVLGIYCKKINNNSNHTISVHSTLIDYEEVGEVSFHQANIVPYIIFNSLDTFKPMKLP